MDNAAEQPGIKMYLELLGRIHAGLDVSERHFASWKQAAIDTACACDPQLDAATRRAWEAVIDNLIGHIVEGIPDARCSTFRAQTTPAAIGMQPG